MNYRITTPCEKHIENCYRGKRRVYATKDEAKAVCKELNEALDQQFPLLGTFSFYETALPVDDAATPEVEE